MTDVPPATVPVFPLAGNARRYVAIGIALPLSPWASYLGFRALSTAYWAVFAPDAGLLHVPHPRGKHVAAPRSLDLIVANRPLSRILWLCEAAHVPTIRATQVLDTLARTWVPSRAEVTDSAASAAAECLILNKGPLVDEAVSVHHYESAARSESCACRRSSKG